MISLPEFRLEVYLGRWEFNARYNLTASDAQTLTIKELLSLGGDEEREQFEQLGLGYIDTWGTPGFRAAVAATYDTVCPDDVLSFAGAEEAMFWVLQELVGSGDHAIITVPNYQSMESVTLATGAAVTGIMLDEQDGWSFDLDAVRSAIRPNTGLVAVNFPNNPTGAIPSRRVFEDLVDLCDEQGIRLLSDEVYRGLELDPARALPQAADLSETAISMNVMSKSYGLAGLRVGWLACRDHDLLQRLERRKHYTSICNSGPGEALATIALSCGERIRARNRSIIKANLPVFDTFFARYDELFGWYHPDGGCVAFVRYNGSDGVENFCRNAVEQEGVVLLPASIYQSRLAEVPTDRFRLGIGRVEPDRPLEALARLIDRGGLSAGRR